jgi:tRNA-splicing ligase RtcB
MLNSKIITFLDPNTIEAGAKQQLFATSKLPIIFKHIAVMPDCHYGKGSTVGSVLATQGAVIPAAVGVDVGCGMIAVKTKFNSNQLPDNLLETRLGIERRIPTGAGGKNQKLSTSATKRYRQMTDSQFYKRELDYTKFKKDWHLQLGTLGSGNHFIELCLDNDSDLWVMLHSGSRGIGNRLADSHIKLAQELNKLWHIPLEDRNLAYLPEKTPEFDSYIKDLLWLQDYALLNREEMMDRVMTELSYLFFKEGGHEAEIEERRINCHHNFTAREHHFGQNVWITRKGAIRMRSSDWGIIPSSMNGFSYIVSGKENPMSFHSAPHGAGRTMSRKKAREQFTMEDYDKQMVGVECRRSPSLLDELPGAYKGIHTVMANSKDLVNVEHVLKQVLVVKGD